VPPLQVIAVSTILAQRIALKNGAVQIELDVAIAV